MMNRHKLIRWSGAAILLVLVFAGCTNGQWVAEGDTCVFESDDDPKRRIINTVDPELCGREVKERGPIRLRVPEPDADED